MAMSDFLANKFLNHLNGVAFTPQGMYLALMLDAVNEVSGGGYTRLDLAAKMSITGDTMSLNIPISFPTATSAWGTISRLAIFDASTGGNKYFDGETNDTRDINSGDTYTILANNFSVQLD